MRYIVEDVNRPHILKGKGLRVFAVRRRFIALVLAVLLIVAAVTGWLVWYFSDIRLDKAEYYILSLCSESSLTAAEAAAKEIIDGGGGGYILNNGEFRITAAAYKTKNDADTVKARMSERFLSATIIDVNIKKTKIKRFDNQSDKQIKSILQYPTELFDYILEENVRLDSFERTESAALLLLSQKTHTLADNKRAIEELLRDYPASAALNKAYNFYDALATEWEQLISPINTDGSLTHRLKYFLCKYIFLYGEMREKL